MSEQTITKPRFGQPCNQCGWCCLEQVCILGAQLGNDQQCKALLPGTGNTYQCGLILDPYRFMPEPALVVWKAMDTIKAGAGLQALKTCNTTMLAAGKGCDSDDPD